MEKFSSRFWWMVDGWKVCSCTCNTGGNRSSKRFITRIRIYFRNRLYRHTCKSRNISCSTVRLPIYEMDLGERWNRAPWFSGQTGLIFHGSLYVCASSTLSVIRVADREINEFWNRVLIEPPASTSRVRGRREERKRWKILRQREKRGGGKERKKERERERSFNKLPGGETSVSISRGNRRSRNSSMGKKEGIDFGGKNGRSVQKATGIWDDGIRRGER